MKLIKQKNKEGKDWWIITHDLTFSEGRLRKLRPIHVFTLLAQNIIKEKKKMYWYSLALENKLFGVRHHQFQLRKALAEVEDPIYLGEYIREYEDQQKVICSLEAYLNSIYTSLEIVSLMNKLIYPSLPQGFRDQSKKYKLFSFSKWKWLEIFYDLRTELEHFGTAIPQISEGTLLIDFSKTGKKYTFNEPIRITFDSILSFSIYLFDMLDFWALEELKKVNPEIEIDSAVETGLSSPPKTKKIKAKEILQLLMK